MVGRCGVDTEHGDEEKFGPHGNGVSGNESLFGGLFQDARELATHEREVGVAVPTGIEFFDWIGSMYFWWAEVTGRTACRYRDR